MSLPLPDERRAALLRAETDALLKSPDFIRSPVMSKLLSYLVEEAISNPGKPPKAYQVAVDGLGRTEDFDVQADSYPRVQVGRLRKMLSAHYAAHGGSAQLHIPIGHYAVEIDIDHNEPEEGRGGKGTSDSEPDGVPIAAIERDRWFDSRQTVIGLAVFLLVIVISLVWIFNDRTSEPSDSSASAEQYVLPPKVYIAVTQPEAQTGESDTSAGIRHFFEDAFARSAQVRLAAADGSAAYRFESQLIAGPTGPEINFSLTAVKRNETIWSTRIPMPESAAEYSDKLGPIASRITSVYGVIATDQREHLPGNAMTGYACLLRFESYRANLDPELLPVVESCIEKSLAADSLDSRILAAASFLSFLREEATGRKPDPEQGLEYARRAMVRGREDASANFALARSSYFTGNCSRGKEFAERSAELDPYEANIQAQIGAYLFACGDPDAIQYLRRAVALDPRGSILAETALALTLLAEGKDEEALQVAENIIPSSTGVGPYYDVTMAMVYAKNGRIEDSRKSWDRLVATYGNEKDESEEQLLRRVIINPLLAERAIQLLVRTGVISD